jgi:hypothetical protein
MKRVHWIVFALAVIFAPGLFAKEKYSQCLDNCRPGVNDCSKCCMAQQDTAAQPCRDKCDATQNKCVQGAEAKCKAANPGKPDYVIRGCTKAEQRQCENTGWDCRFNCSRTNWDIPGNCPGEVLPQKCPFNCQTWNSASKSCVGAPMNACK